MLAHGGGKIINTASMASLIVPHPQKQAAYNASKSAVVKLTQSLGCNSGHPAASTSKTVHLARHRRHAAHLGQPGAQAARRAVGRRHADRQALRRHRPPGGDRLPRERRRPSPWEGRLVIEGGQTLWKSNPRRASVHKRTPLACDWNLETVCLCQSACARRVSVRLCILTLLIFFDSFMSIRCSARPNRFRCCCCYYSRVLALVLFLSLSFPPPHVVVLLPSSQDFGAGAVPRTLCSQRTR